jgi:hypothetical protein
MVRIMTYWLLPVVLLANFSAPSIASVPELTKYVVSKGAGSNEAKSLQYSTAGLCEYSP